LTFLRSATRVVRSIATSSCRKNATCLGKGVGGEPAVLVRARGSHPPVSTIAPTPWSGP
jgi:hypothetical protein